MTEPNTEPVETTTNDVADQDDVEVADSQLALPDTDWAEL